MTETPADKKLSERFAEAISAFEGNNESQDRKNRTLAHFIWQHQDRYLSALRLSESRPSAGAFNLGDLARKKSGASWRGKIVGFYATDLTPRGYCVESANEPGSVQIYPEAALVEWKPELSHPSAIRARGEEKGNG